MRLIGRRRFNPLLSSTMRPSAAKSSSDCLIPDKPFTVFMFEPFAPAPNLGTIGLLLLSSKLLPPPRGGAGFDLGGGGGRLFA